MKMLTEWKSIWNRGGVIKQVSWIDKDIIVWCSGGTHLIFFHLKKKLQTLWRCPSSIDGVTSITSYPQMHLIGFSEGCCNPRILILTYPSMMMISECLDGTKNRYISTIFAPPDLIISLSSSPDYNLTLWNWRNGVKIFSISTSIHDLEEQVMKVSRGKSGLIAQLGKTSGKLLIWKIVRNSISPVYEQVDLPKKSSPVDVDWSPDSSDPLLAVVDDSGHVYLWNKNGGDINRIILSQRCATCLDYENPTLSWFNDGILLKTTFCQLRFYRNKGDVWRREWYIKTLFKPHILVADPFRKEKLIFFDCQGDLMEMMLGIEENFPKIEKIFSCGSCFKLLEMIYPWGHHLVVVDESKNIVIMMGDKGVEIGRLNLNVKGEIVKLRAHFELPIIVISTSAGELCLVTIHDFENPRILCKYQLGEYSLEIVKFSQCGRYLITGRKRYGLFYCIESIEKTSSTIRKIETNHRILDILIFTKNEELVILMLILPLKKSKAGNFITIHKLLPHETNVGDAVCVMKLPFLYETLHYGLDPMTIISAPLSSLHLHIYKVQDGGIYLKNVIQSQHKIRGIKVDTNKDCILTYGFDGIISVIKNFKTLEFLTSVNSHHRSNLGISKVILKPSGDLMIALGSDGSLIGMKLSKNDEKIQELSFDNDRIDEKKLKENISMDYSKLTPETIEMLARSYQTIPPEDSGVDNWSDWMIKQQEMREEDEYRKIKSSIIEDFDKLKGQVSKLLDKNEKLPDNERLPISAFDLDMIQREQKIKGGREERDDRRLELEFQCSQIEKVSNWIRKIFWDVQMVKQQSIFPIFGDTEVINFPSVGQDPQEVEMTRWVEFFDHIGDDSSDFDTEPRAYRLIKDWYSPIVEDERTILENLFDEEDEIIKKERIEEIQAASGITTFRFIESSSEYSQFKNYSFPQLLKLKNSLITDAQILKNYFNKSFNEIFALKERAMSSCIQTISHIRFIDSELRLMFNTSVPEIPMEPQWSPKEKPESIITVSDNEVPVKPYVSPSEQVILDKQAEEQERIRQLMLFDDFRRKALIQMMDGVLEYRWEDVIKKDIPQLEFMLTKDPEDYTKEEIIMAQDYEKKVLNLQQERERYKGFLETSYSKMMKTLGETIDKFNSNLQGLLVTRMKVESAIFQLDLLRARWYLQAFDKIKMLKEVEKIKDKISEQESKIDNILSSNKIIGEEIFKLKSQREALHNKEKAAKKFKAEFQSLGKTTVELLKKYYKRRPKVVLRNASTGDVLALAKCITTRNTSVPLLPEQRLYLTSLEALDVQPEDPPESVNQSHWEHLVKIRRHQIDLEMKLKANLMEIHEIEKNIVENNVKIGKSKEIIANFSDCLRDIHKNEAERIKDMEIQLVLRMGQVEIDLRGHTDDAHNSRLIPVEMIKRMNQGILKAGDDKLKALEEMINFRRGILLKEWEHKCLQMKMQELQEEINEIDNMLVTKTMRQILKKANNSKGFKTVQDLEKEIQAMEQIKEKSLNDWVLKIQSIEKQIEAKKKENCEFDRKIEEINVDRWEMELKRDLEAERKSKEINEETMRVILKRAKICRKICKVYMDLLELKIERELLRMKKYPTLPGFNVIEMNNYHHDHV